MKVAFVFPGQGSQQVGMLGEYLGQDDPDCRRYLLAAVVGFMSGAVGTGVTMVAEPAMVGMLM